MGEVVDTAGLTLFSPEEALQPQLIPMEINLEGWPLFSRQKTPEGSAFEVGQVISTDDGRRLEQMWRVTASHDFSLPGPYDEDIFVGVMALVRRRGGMPKDGKIRFSVYELVKVLGKAKRGENYRKIKDSLDRIASTNYYSKNAFYVLGDESLETYRFTLWTVHFSSARGRDGRSAEHHTLSFDDIIIRSYNSGYLKLLDTDLYFRLKIPLAKALYRLVDQRRAGTLSWTVDIRYLRDLLVMSKSYGAPSRIWEVLAPAHRALKREKFLESVTLDGDSVRYRIRQDFAQDRIIEEETAAREEAPPTLQEEAVAALIAHKMWPKRARALVDRFGPEKAFHALDVLELRTGLRTDVSNSGAYVAEVMETGNPAELEEMSRFLATGRSDQREDSGTQLNLLPNDPEHAEDANGSSPPPLPDPDAQSVWDEVLESVSEEINTPTLRVWFEGAVATDLRDHTLTLAVPNDLAEEYIERRFKTSIEASLKSRLSPTASLRLVVPSQPRADIYT